MTRPTAAVMVVALEDALPAACLSSLTGTRWHDADVEIVLVRRKSSPTTSPDSTVTVVTVPADATYAAALTAGIATTSTDVVAVVDSLAVLESGCLTALLDALTERPGTGMVVSASERAAPWPATAASKYVARDWSTPDGIAPATEQVLRSGCFVFWRVVARREVFSPALPLPLAVAAFCAQAGARGYPVRLVPGAATSGPPPAWSLLPDDATWSRGLLDYGRLTHGRLWNARLTVAALRDGASLTDDAAARAKGVISRARGSFPGTLQTLSRAARRRWFLIRLRLAVIPMRATIDAEIHPSADIATDVRLEIRRGTKATLRLGAETKLRDRVLLRLGGNAVIDLGENVDIRYDCTLNIKGHLTVESRVAIGRGTSIHCDGVQRWGFGSIAGEYTSVIDSNHDPRGLPLPVTDEPVSQADISIGAGVFLGAGVRVLAGSTIGEGTVVGANSVVTKDLPPRVLAAGIPARVLRALG